MFPFSFSFAHDKVHFIPSKWTINVNAPINTFAVISIRHTKAERSKQEVQFFSDSPIFSDELPPRKINRLSSHSRILLAIWYKHFSHKLNVIFVIEYKIFTNWIYLKHYIFYGQKSLKNLGFTF